MSAWRDGDVPLCPYDGHEWIRDTAGERPLIIPSFVVEDEGVVRRMVQVRCLKCDCVTRLEIGEFSAKSKWA